MKPERVIVHLVIEMGRPYGSHFEQRDPYRAKIYDELTAYGEYGTDVEILSIKAVSPSATQGSQSMSLPDRSRLCPASGRTMPDTTFIPTVNGRPRFVCPMCERDVGMVGLRIADHYGNA